MLAVIMFLNSKGDVALSRSFRSGYNVRTLAETFRNELVSTKQAERCPVNIINRTCFIHMKLSELYVVMVANSNVNCLMCLQYGVRLLQHIHSRYESLDEKTIKENFTALLGLIDESMDFGYPVLTDGEASRAFITSDGMDTAVLKNAKESETIADRMTGETPWRVEGLIYRVNEVFVDVFEDVNLLISQTGEMLQSNVTGRVVMKDFLSGMPWCELFLNAELAHSTETSGVLNEEGPAVKLSDVAFHNCVRLTKNEMNKEVITFMPPDGKFTLMTYRSTVSVQPPLRVISSNVKEISKTRTEIQFMLKSDLPAGQVATGVEIRVPCPDNTATVSAKVVHGKAKYEAISDVIVWKIPQVRSGEETAFSAEITQIAPTDDAEKLWARPPISMSFECISHSLTGLQILELKVNDPTVMGAPNKWIRYTVKAGDYQCRI